MQIIKARTAGFCMGVDRALRMALEESDDAHGRVWTYGALIHNPQVVEQLRQRGVEILREDGIKPGEGTVVLRAHGVAPAIQERLESSGYRVVDAACPHVVRIHRLIQRHLENGTELILIIGDRGHAEVNALMGHAGDAGFVIETLEDVDQLPDLERVCVVSQTTQSHARYEELLSKILQRWPDANTYCTICDATEDRQNETVEIAKQVDVMIVVGGYNSANTVRLSELAGGTGTATYHVESSDEMKAEWFAGAEKVGLSAGASTPPDVIAEAEAMIRKLSGQ